MTDNRHLNPCALHRSNDCDLDCGGRDIPLVIDYDPLYPEHPQAENVAAKLRLHLNERGFSLADFHLYEADRTILTLAASFGNLHKCTPDFADAFTNAADRSINETLDANYYYTGFWIRSDLSDHYHETYWFEELPNERVESRTSG